MYRPAHIVLLMAALLVRATPATATASWNFVETSLTYVADDQPVLDVILPQQTAALSVSDHDFLNGGISYSYQQLGIGSPTPTYMITGDTDFSFDVVGSLIASPVVPDPLVFDASVNLSFDQAGALSGSIIEDSDFDNFRMYITNNVASAVIASDFDSFGCPHSQCAVSGYWELSIPEPKSVVMLAMSLVLARLLRRSAEPEA